MEAKTKLITEIRDLISKHKEDTVASKACMLKYPSPGKTEYSDSNWLIYFWSQEFRDELEKVIVSLLRDEANFNEGLELILSIFSKYKVNVWNENREFDRQRWSK